MSLQRLLILTGDPSADMHAAHIVTALKERSPNLDIHAVGGHHLQATGIPLISDQSKMARVGFGSVLGSFDHWCLGKKILKHCDVWMPDAVLLIDYGVFHLWMAAQLKKRFKARCPKIYYFIPPQVWASRKGRIKKVKKVVDHVFSIFPFEKGLYDANGIPCTYVGHPLLSQMPPAADRSEFCKAHQLDVNKPVVGIFPGSRKLEVDYLLGTMLNSAALIREQRPETQFIIAKAKHLSSDFFQAKLQKTLASVPNPPTFHIIEDANHAILSISDALILASGTVTLEAALYTTPLVLIYRLHPIVFYIAIRILLLPYIGLPNILHGVSDINHPHENSLPAIAPEFLQDDATPEAVSQALLPFLNPDDPKTREVKAAFRAIRDKLAYEGKPAAQRVAEALLAQ